MTRAGSRDPELGSVITSFGFGNFERIFLPFFFTIRLVLFRVQLHASSLYAQVLGRTLVHKLHFSYGHSLGEYLMIDRAWKDAFGGTRPKVLSVLEHFSVNSHFGAPFSHVVLVCRYTP